MGNTWDRIRCVKQDDQQFQVAKPKEESHKNKKNRNRMTLRSMRQSKSQKLENIPTAPRSFHMDLEYEQTKVEEGDLTNESFYQCTIKSFDIKYMIGEGAYGKVFLVQKRDTGNHINLFPIN